jgi:hypothetical protein
MTALKSALRLIGIAEQCGGNLPADCLEDLKCIVRSLLNDGTELVAFFLDVEWRDADVRHILKYKQRGLDDILRRYRGQPEDTSARNHNQGTPYLYLVGRAGIPKGLGTQGA